MTDPQMTEFERQVADALWQSWPAVTGPAPSPEEVVREWLAPRVAAAMRESAREAVAYTGARELMDEAANEAQEVGLAALRGTPDP